MKPMPPGCPGEELLAAWQDGEADTLLDATQARDLAGHVSQCVHCRACLDALAALESDLHTLNLVHAAPDPVFTRAILAALLAPAVPAAAPSWRMRWTAWWQQGLGAALMVAGLAIMLATGDALALLNGWGQQIADWLNSGLTPDGTGLNAWSGALPGSGFAPDANLGLIVGAITLTLGASVFLITALVVESPAPAPQLRTVRNH